jgi:hypothetical protein
MPRVEFSTQNLTMCLCPGCPVQGASNCAWGRIQQAQIPQDISQVSDPKTLVRLYCSIGKTDCGDFDGDQNCICPNCQVWKNNELASRYFCLRGNADEIDISSSTGG